MGRRPMAPERTSPFCFGPGNSAAGDSGGRGSPAPGHDATLALVGGGLRASSGAIYRRDVADFLGWWGRSPEEVAAADIAQYLAERAATPAAADRRRAALAHLYRAGIEAGQWAVDPTAGLPRARRGAWRDGGQA